MLTSDREMLAYVNAKLHPFEPEPGTFLGHFLRAAQTADMQNYALLRPALVVISQKYPAKPERLAEELNDIPEMHDIDGLQWLMGGRNE